MRSFRIGTLVFALAAFAAPALVACSADPSQAREAAGTLSLNLSGTGTSGAKFRLRNASFTVAGAKAVTLSSETNVDSPVISQELPAGNYVITLKTGWTLEKSTDGGMTFATISAVLTSTNPAGFVITDQGKTTVPFNFKAGADVVQLGDGTLNVVINVNDGCATGQTACGSSCVDLTSDPQNCGACGAVCSGANGMNPNSGGQCVMGVCQTVCPAGSSLCNGVCTSLFSDPLNCGSCGNACQGGSQCLMGACQSVCPAGSTQCNGVCTSLFSDPLNCGACGNACQATANAGAQCSMGACVQVCNAGFSTCNGFCANLQSDNDNCGACGNRCGTGFVCINGLCLL